MRIDPSLLRTPVEFLHAVHLREREICALLDRIADRARAASGEIEAALRFLSDELPAHLDDEEQDLFPMLRARCSDDDEIDRLLDQLHADHCRASALTPRITGIVGDAGSGLDAGDCDELRRYAGQSRRHLILENAVLLPFARLRLTPADLEQLRAAMTRRRSPRTTLEPKHAE
ncbi:hemerythrin domain-containing protein [Halovulum dunhuangense]|uniref:Hemerythrin domain-containing protein n=1 Tax=Halovulum dunhuangense TaxID=1505036 RepID=A0A849L7J7_9RHOB|nr:hemerythrin domain-containing protein [Halovulum dunhuangense]NNU82021.1 hemerythrin domain-containing protein [Halovulum dunhuangense]